MLVAWPRSGAGPKKTQRFPVFRPLCFYCFVFFSLSVTYFSYVCFLPASPCSFSFVSNVFCVFSPSWCLERNPRVTFETACVSRSSCAAASVGREHAAPHLARRPRRRPPQQPRRAVRYIPSLVLFVTRARARGPLFERRAIRSSRPQKVPRSPLSVALCHAGPG